MDQRFEFRVHGLACGGGGARSIEKRISRLPGVVDVYVNPANATAYVTVGGDGVEPEQLTDAVAKAGYRAGQVRRLRPRG